MIPFQKPAQNRYSPPIYSFKEILEAAFNVKDLHYLHAHYPNYKEVVKRETDQSTPFHKMYYKMIREEWAQDLFKSFVKNCIKPIFECEIVYQKIPTFRVQFPQNLGVGEWHKDKDYNHNLDEINVFVPFTDAVETSTIWIESEEDKGDYKPLNSTNGMFTLFNGCHLKHGNKVNETPYTRVSFDFRVIPRHKFKEESGKESINTKMKFKIGDYYDVI